MQTEKQQTTISCTPIYCEGGTTDLGGLGEGLGWFSALKKGKPHYEGGSIVYPVIDYVPGVGVCKGEAILAGSGSPETVS